MKRHLIAFLSAALAGLPSVAADYDERLEFVESTGTQWIDTGVKPNWKRSDMRLDFRVLEALPVAVGRGVAIAGVTGVKDDASGSAGGVRRSFVMGLGHPSNGTGKYQMWPYFTGGTGGGYRYPDNDVGTDDYRMTWNVRSGWQVRTDSPANSGTNRAAFVNGRGMGNFYSAYPDEESAHSFYIGAANNAGEGLLTPDGSLAKIHWYGVQLFTDGELVGDFIPVKKGGVAGFYDTVSKRFFASQGADAWVAPTTVTWTGAGAAGDLADPGNWGGSAPTTCHEVAVIPDGTELEGTAESLAAAFNGLGGVRLDGADARLCLNGVSAATSLYFPVGGTGTYRMENVPSSTVALHSYQSLWNFYGTTQVSNVYVYIRQPAALGLQGRSAADVSLGGGSQRLSLYGGGTYAAVAFRRHGQFGFVSNDFIDFDCTAWSFPESSVNFHGNGSATWYVLGAVTGRTDAQNTFMPYSMTKCALAGEPKSLNLTQLIADCGTLAVDAPVHTMARAKDAAGAGQDQANIRLNAGRNLVFGHPNALDANCFVQVGYASGPAEQKSNVIDLGGTDQRLGTLSVWAGSFDGTTTWNPNLVLKSDAPATLTLHGQLRTATDDTSRHVFPGVVSGAASVMLDSRADVMAEAWNWADANAPGGIRFNCPGSDTSGTLAAARGTLEVMATASFPNLSGVVVSGTGVVKLSTAAVGSDNAGFTVAIRDATARLELAAGVTLVCNTCELPGGAALSPGRYSATGADGTTVCAFLSGGGVLEVKNALWTGWPAAGAASRVEIPRGTAVTITDADIANVEALDEIACQDDVTILIETTAALDLKAKLSGPVTVTANGVGPLTLSGDNAGIVAPGHFELTDLAGGLTVAHFNALGGADTATAVLTQTRGALDGLTFRATDGVFTNRAPLRLVHPAGSANAVTLGAANAGETLVFANGLEIAVAGSGENYWKARNGVQVIHGTFRMNSHVRIADGGKARIALLGDTVAELGRGGGAIIYISNGFTLGGKSVWAANGLSPDAARSITFAKANCLGADCVLASYVNGSATHFDFGGYDQEIGRLRHANAGAADCPQLTSATPATLKAVGTVTATESVRYAFTGALGYWHDTVQDLTLTAPSASTGALTVSKGSVTLADAASWAGEAVTVMAGGALACASPDSLATGHHALTVERGGALTVASGVTLKVKTATLGGVTLEPSTVYAVEQLQALGTGVTLAGGGAIQTGAKSITGDWTGWPDAGTATEAQVPDGVTAEVTDADLDRLAALETVTCGADSKVVFRTTRKDIRLAAKFTGGASVEVFTDGATVVLDGDNSGLVSPGGFVFSNTTVIVSNRYGLGSVRTAPATFTPAQPFAANQSRLFFDGPAAVTNDCALLFDYGCRVGHRDPSVRFVQANDVTQRYGLSASSRRFAVTNDLTLAAGSRMDLGQGGTDLLGGARFRIEDGATFRAEGSYGAGTCYIAGDCAGRFVVEQTMQAFVFERANVCGGIAELRYLDASYGRFAVDLNGHDQALPCLVGNLYWNANQQTLTVTSAVPATLTLSGAGTSGGRGVAARFLGQVSLAKHGAYTQTVGCAVSTATGTLTVDGGTLAFERGAAWTGGDITVNGGEILVRADSVDGAFGSGRKGSPSLFLNGAGRLNLPEAGDTPLKVRMVSRDGVLQERGDYSAANCDWIVGAGTVRVVRGVPKGLIYLIR